MKKILTSIVFGLMMTSAGAAVAEEVCDINSVQNSPEFVRDFFAIDSAPVLSIELRECGDLHVVTKAKHSSGQTGTLSYRSNNGNYSTITYVE